jgi:hypothetical protein
MEICKHFEEFTISLSEIQCDFTEHGATFREARFLPQVHYVLYFIKINKIPLLVIITKRNRNAFQMRIYYFSKLHQGA